MARRYGREVKEFIAANVEGRTTRELAELVNARFGTQFTAGSMKSYKANYGLRSGTPTGIPKGSASSVFPQPVVDYIRANYQGCGPAEMAERLNAGFGTSYTAGQINAYYKNHKLRSGLTGRFEKGRIPENKGQKGRCAPGCEKGWFTTGSAPVNKTPIGTIRKRPGAGDYLYEKTGDGAHDWELHHQLVWERAHGKPPDGYVVTFRDGDKNNCGPDNLMLVSKPENAVMNRWRLRSSAPELTDAGVLIARIKIAAANRKKKKPPRSKKEPAT